MEVESKTIKNKLSVKLTKQISDANKENQDLNIQYNSQTEQIIALFKELNSKQMVDGRGIVYVGGAIQ